MTAVLTVDLAAFQRNLDVVRERVAPAELMLVVKDDAYAHGLEPIVTHAARHGVRWFGAFDVATGLRVRATAGPDAGIFVWMVFGVEEARRAIDAALDLGVGDADTLEEIALAAEAAGRTARLHLKIDTGLHRNGVRPEQWPAFVERAAELAAAGVVEIIGVWSHIAEASDAEDDAARARYEAALRVVEARGRQRTLRHLAASAASFDRAGFRYDMVRVGAFCYGIRSAGGPGEDVLGVQPIATLDAPVLALGDEGVRIGIGSADGLPSVLGGRMSVGTPDGPRRMLRIDEMDCLVEPWPGAAVGQRVRIMGQGTSSPTDLAEAMGSIGEEIAVRVSPLVERRYR
ncbi:alanine racemase [Microbacterium caowuchunii]|uniref:alanine racemase n=1 Tax=Microbacterium caowuchunii TaxID=2614638 RepID=UPI001244135E|nr:alanine racemase [Microbacterium caowuchunii]QEW00088.1 alanine racemase [Microbacterium caowuchunii]